MLECRRFAAAIGLFCLAAAGQTASPHFEVVSVKPAASGAGGLVGFRGGPGTPDPGRITYTNVSLSMVIQRAYDVWEDQISAPAWISTQRYDIAATIPAGATTAQFRVMLQNVLSERFHLEFHRTRKEFGVWDLLPAKGGIKLKAGGNLNAASAADARGGSVDRNGFPAPPVHQVGQRTLNGVAMMTANQIAMSYLAGFLGGPLRFIDGGPQMTAGRVTDKTGLAGEFTFNLEYEWPGQRPPGADPGDLAPDLFTALQQQLGLRLEKTKQDLDVLVIDRAEKTPSEN